MIIGDHGLPGKRIAQHAWPSADLPAQDAAAAAFSDRA
jgi:hypothetical protein